MSISSILQQVGTPLQLVGLFLLLAVGLARLLLRAWPPKAAQGLVRLTIDRAFQASVVALVLGVLGPTIAPVLDRWLNREVTFHGAVLSTSGEAVAGATVNLITLATVSTNGLGQFDITIPANRALKEYEIQVSAPDYHLSPVIKKAGSEIGSIEIRLQPMARELVKSLENPLIVGQYYGAPFVIATLRVENATDQVGSIGEIRAQLFGRDASLSLSPVYWTIANSFGPFAPITAAIPIPPRMNFDLHVVMTANANYAGVLSQIAGLPEYRAQTPCAPKRNGVVDPLASSAFRIVKAFAEEHFAWTDGKWRLQIDVRAQNQASTFQREFELSTGEVDHLRASVALMRQCMAVNLATPIAQDGAVANFLTK